MASYRSEPLTQRGDIQPTCDSLPACGALLVLPHQRLPPRCPGSAWTRRAGEGRAGQRLRFTRWAFSAPLRLRAAFHGDFISSELLIKFHIYDQKIKSLDLFEIGFYEFWLRQLSQQSRPSLFGTGVLRRR